MNLALPGHSAPAAGFEVPLEMLAACHLRVQSQCATLQRLVTHLAAHGADRAAQEAAAAVMRYFDTSAVHHHQDEEVDLFPALAAQARAEEATAVHDLLASLRADHRELETRWAQLRAPLALVAQGGAAALTQPAVHGFTSLYDRHIALEESRLLPLAARLLGPAELDGVGLAMRQRRGLLSPGPPDPASR